MNRKVKMLLKSVQVNVVMSVKVKGVIDLKMLEKLIAKTKSYTSGEVFAAVFTVTFFVFFRLSTLLLHLTRVIALSLSACISRTIYCFSIWYDHNGMFTFI